MSKFKMHHFHAAGQSPEIDLVCGMEVDQQNPPFIKVYKNKTYHFCSEACKFLFEREPEKYIRTGES